MKTAILRRKIIGDTGTFGELVIDDQKFTSGELPPRGNAKDLSSIPAGEYLCKWQWSPKWKRDVYHLQDVPGRTVIEIHPANHFGDTALGLHAEVDGCIALGTGQADVCVVKDGKQILQHGIVGSRMAVQKFETLMDKQDFLLKIVDEYLEVGEPEFEGAIV